MNHDDALDSRLTLGTAFDEKPKVIRVKARGGDSESHWTNIPVEIFRSMLGVLRGNEVGKALPQGFADAEILMTARIPVKKGLARHQAILLLEHEGGGEVQYSVVHLVAQSNTDPWGTLDGSESAFTSREEAFDEFTERLYRRGVVSRNRKSRD